MKFGQKQLAHPTPSQVLNFVRVTTVILSTFLGWLQTIDFIPANTIKIISGIAGLLLAILNGITPFFGVTPTGDSVPIEKVTSMDAPPKE